MGISGQAGSSSQTGKYQEKEKKICWWAFRGLEGETVGDHKRESKYMRDV